MRWLQAFFPNDQHPDHHKPLDGLRGIAVLMVVFGHGYNQGLGPFGESSLLIRGKLGYTYSLCFPPTFWTVKSSRCFSRDAQIGTIGCITSLAASYAFSHSFFLRS